MPSFKMYYYHFYSYFNVKYLNQHEIIVIYAAPFAAAMCRGIGSMNLGRAGGARWGAALGRAEAALGPHWGRTGAFWSG